MSKIIEAAKQIFSFFSQNQAIFFVYHNKTALQFFNIEWQPISHCYNFLWVMQKILEHAKMTFFYLYACKLIKIAKSFKN